jgi:hypothetical protein
MAPGCGPVTHDAHPSRLNSTVTVRNQPLCLCLAPPPRVRPATALPSAHGTREDQKIENNELPDFGPRERALR